MVKYGIYWLFPLYFPFKCGLIWNKVHNWYINYLIERDWENRMKKREITKTIIAGRFILPAAVIQSLFS